MSTEVTDSTNNIRFANYVWIVLAYILIVILWGAYVRATGSGAGCGNNWPLCNGDIVPRPERIETVIEFTHRISSALSGILVIVMVIWAFRAFPKGHIVRFGSVMSLVFIVTEGLLGAGLVLFELVADNSSAARAISGAVHLINTFVLVGFITLTAWWAGGGARLRVRGQGAISWLLAIGFVAMLLLGASGAVTALGDTLYPVESLADGIRQDLNPGANFLIQLRIYHPAIAILVGLYLIWSSSYITRKRSSGDTVRFSRGLRILFIIQLAAGAINVFLLAPVWMQMVHLLLADLVLIAYVLFSASALSQEIAETEASIPAPAPEPG